MTKLQSQFEPAALGGDFLNQLLHVGGSSWRLLACQDRDPCSPTFGSFHYPYWRDKTSEFPDARFQEAGAALALLTLPAFDGFRATQDWPSNNALMATFSAGLRDLARQQYPEGCYDEWYKGERGFAATAFSTVAYGIAGILLHKTLSPEDRALLTRTLRQAAGWLSGYEDLVKTNHEIVAAAALAAVWKLTGEDKWRDAAARKLQLSIANQTQEGWFLELGGADLGYGYLILDYVMLYYWLTGDEAAPSAASRLLDFLTPHLHPDLTVAAEAGTCRNAYVGQIGFILSDHATARSVRDKLRAMPKANSRLSFLRDDLRLTRWASLAIAAAYLESTRQAPTPTEERAFYPDGWTVHSGAALAAYHAEPLHLYIPAAGGAVIRVYRGEQLIYEDLGPDIREGRTIFTSRTYDAGRQVIATRDGVSMQASYSEARYVFPSFTQRLALRFLSSTPSSARFIRGLIDRYRIKHKTAGNQSAASTKAGATDRFSLSRQIEIKGSQVRISDILTDRAGALSSDVIAWNMFANGSRAALPSVTFARAGTLKTTVVMDADSPDPQPRYELSHE